MFHRTLGLFALLALAFAAVTAHADLNPQIKVGSFIRIGGAETKLAELCGIVTGNDSTPMHLEIVVDPKTSAPGTYHTTTGIDGRFCLLIRTLSGLAELSLVGKMPVESLGVTIQN